MVEERASGLCPVLGWFSAPVAWFHQNPSLWSLWLLKEPRVGYHSLSPAHPQAGLHSCIRRTTYRQRNTRLLCCLHTLPRTHSFLADSLGFISPQKRLRSSPTFLYFLIFCTENSLAFLTDFFLNMKNYYLSLELYGIYKYNKNSFVQF